MVIKHWRRFLILAAVTWVWTGLLSVALIPPAQAHWADLAVAEFQIQPQQAKVVITVPTGLLAIADTNRDQKLSSSEVQTQQAQLRQFLGDRVILKTLGQPLTLSTVSLEETALLQSGKQLAPSSHSTLQLDYENPKQAAITAIDYRLFLPDVPTATCVATILSREAPRQFIFSPQNQEFAFNSLTQDLFGMPIWLAFLAAFVWGAFHSLSPGHGKSIVAAYLSGAKATPQHAIFLGLTTTVTHTTGIFLLGLGALFAAQFVQIEAILPWLSVFSGALTICIGLELLVNQLRGKSFHNHTHGPGHGHSHDLEHEHHHPSHSHLQIADDAIHDHPHLDQPLQTLAAHPDAELINLFAHVSPVADGAQAHSSDLLHVHDHPHDHDHFHPHDHNHPHDHDHPHNHNHPHDHDHNHPHHHGHDDLSKDAKIRWGSLLAIGISGGLVPCPSALILLLSSISFGHVALGLLLVVAFSFGLAGVLTGLGLLLIYARNRFERFSVPPSWFRFLPTFSAVLITLLGVGLVFRAIFSFSTPV